MSSREDNGPELRELAGTLEHLRHHNEEDGWTVARLRVADGSPGAGAVVTIVGNLAQAREGMELRLWGDWATHPQYGEQFRFLRYEVPRPITPDAIKRFLSGGSIRGIGPKRAEAIVAHFGADTLRILDEHPERLTEIVGIGSRQAHAIAEAWRRHRETDQQGVLVRLQGLGITAAQAIRIHRHYADQSLAAIEHNPYQLAMDVEGIGFKTADRIARALGLPLSSPFRLQAGLVHALQSAAAGQGHCFLPRERLLLYAARLLECEDQESLQDAHQTLAADGRVVVEQAVLPPLSAALDGQGADDAVYLPRLHRAEQEVARHLRRLKAAAPQVAAAPHPLEQWLQGDRRAGGASLSDEQAQAVRLALSDKVVVLTGGPGVGKTTVTRAIVELFEKSECRVLLASPTGRAAKRLSEVTGRPAQTIHRLLEIDPVAWQFRRSERRPLEADAVIVDEASMLDIELMWSLVQAIPDQARLILVGDVDQLPSVGPGLVLRDLIQSRAVSVARLTEIFRQDRESQIVMNAYRVNAGRLPEFHAPPRPADDCIFLPVPDQEALLRQVMKVVGEDLLDEGFQASDIQVLTPMNKRALGTQRLNAVLQQALNPPQPAIAELRRGDKCLREGDRVVQTVNNYAKEVFNGDVGAVVQVDAPAGRLAVQFPDTAAWYEHDDLEELELAYALTVHKAQGSEYPVVVMICHTSHHFMLQRNLLYTGLTRAQRKCIIVGDRPAVWTAVRNNRQARRFTRLRQLLAASSHTP